MSTLNDRTKIIASQLALTSIVDRTRCAAALVAFREVALAVVLTVL